MEHWSNPVPDVEALSYQGTPDKPDIKIFISHRIDQDSVTVDNPLYIPVRCGAALDTREDVPMLGDDTGDHISEKRNTFSELTVLYWAWKNVQADYYGLGQYRRYLSFSRKSFPDPGINFTGGASTKCLIENCLDQKRVKKYGLLERNMRTQITGQDLITVEEIDLVSMLNVASNCEQMTRSPHSFVPSDFDVLQDVVSEKYPGWMDEFTEYFYHVPHARWYNCFIMKREIFFDYCEWLFDILFEFEKRIDVRGRGEKPMRAAAYMGERLTGLYIYHLVKQNRYKIEEKQLVFFKSTKLKTPPKKKFLKQAFKKLFPYGSKPYVFFKRHYFKWKGVYYDPARDISHREYTGIFDKIAPISTRRFMRRMDKLSKDVKASKNAENQLLTLACWANEIRDLHKETFSPYKYCNYGKDLVILATGPTIMYYDAIPGAKHIGVNGACGQNRIPLDYYFLIDGTGIGRAVDKDDIKDLDCDKFIGIYLNKSMFYRSGVSEVFAREVGAKKFITAHVHYYRDIGHNIEYCPLMEGWTVTATAMHFALYTHPKRIFLVGNDASTSYGEHYDGKTGGDGIHSEGIIKIYNMIRTFVNRYYPDIEIISVNPIGLRGMFRDVYTQPYLDAHPEAKKGLGRCYELLPDIINEPPKEEFT